MVRDMPATGLAGTVGLHVAGFRPFSTISVNTSRDPLSAFAPRASRNPGPILRRHGTVGDMRDHDSCQNPQGHDEMFPL